MRDKNKEGIYVVILKVNTLIFLVQSLTVPANINPYLMSNIIDLNNLNKLCKQFLFFHTKNISKYFK